MLHLHMRDMRMRSKSGMRANICEEIHHADTPRVVFNHINDNNPSWISRLFGECITGLRMRECALLFHSAWRFERRPDVARISRRSNVDGCCVFVRRIHCCVHNTYSKYSLALDQLPDYPKLCWTNIELLHCLNVRKHRACSLNA